MNKEQALNDFLQGFRIVLNNAFAYFKEHPYFIKSVDIFKQKINVLFRFMSPIKIDITPHSLFIDGKYWEKAMLYVELAQVFHFRKIKSIEFRVGITTEELFDFLSSVSLPTREILRRGGIQNILNRKSNPYLFIEELDYSELLRDEGEESKDIWVYLFGEVIDKEDLHKINKFVDNFGKIIGKFKTNDLFEDEELRRNIYTFLTYLKGKEEDKFYNCTKVLLRLFLRDKNIAQGDKLDKIRIFFKDLDKDDFTEILLDEISTNEDFNYLNFKVFFQLINEDMHKEIAPALEEKIKTTASLKANPKIRKRIKELFSVSESSFISALYHNALYWLSDEHILMDSFSFDRDLAHKNYRFLLLNLFAEEKNKERLNLILELLLKECNNIVKEKNLEYLKFLLEVLNKRIKEDVSLTNLFEGLEGCISNFIENTIFKEETLVGLEYFIDTLRKSFLGFSFYLDKIFNERKVNTYALKLLLKFFPDNLAYIYENLEKKHSDIDFLSKIVKSLEGIDPSLSIDILKRIFYFSNNIIKIEVLKSMQRLSRYDYEFLFSILKNKETFLKKEALVILARNEKTRKMALEELLFIPSPFGRKNKVLMEHIMVIEDIELKEAKDYLVTLSKKPFFWNRNVRKKASEVLKNWHA